MNTSLADRQAITDLMTGWMYRDLGDWDRLRSLFHEDGAIEVTWFEGRSSDFIDASMQMGRADLQWKHVLANSLVTLAYDRAIVETNVMIVGENVRLGLGCCAHSRFHDLVEKRDGRWRIVQRRSIYDSAHFTFTQGPVAIDQDVSHHPSEYAALAYLLEKSGLPVRRTLATKGSDIEGRIRERAHAWIDG